MLLIVDMQNDFIDQRYGKMPVRNGDLLVPKIIKRIKEYEKKGDIIFYTINIHNNMPNDNRSYDKRKWGERIYKDLEHILKPHRPIEKYNYGIPSHKTQSIFRNIKEKYIEEVEIVGVETNICILSNAIILQNTFPNSKILVNENLCTSNDLLLHNKALDIMEGLQIEVIRK